MINSIWLPIQLGSTRPMQLLLQRGNDGLESDDFVLQLGAPFPLLGHLQLQIRYSLQFSLPAF